MDDSPSFYKRLLDNLHDGVYFVDKDRRITYWNNGAAQITGYDPQEAVGRHCYDNFLLHIDEQGCALCLNGCPLAATIADGEHREAEVYLQHKGGHRVPVSVRVSPIVDDAGCTVGAVEVFSDITEKKNIERRAGELEHLAYRDPLTGAANRRYVELKVQQAIQEVENFGRSIGLLMLDVDHFKKVNDIQGHDAGDLTLKAICKTLWHALRPNDIVGRWGGEEFLIIVSDVDPTTLFALADRCRMLIAVGGEAIKITVSLGATLLRKDDSHQSAIKRADELMYKSKASGRNRTTIG